MSQITSSKESWKYLKEILPSILSWTVYVHSLVRIFLFENVLLYSNSILSAPFHSFDEGNEKYATKKIKLKKIISKRDEDLKFLQAYYGRECF